MSGWQRARHLRGFDRCFFPYVRGLMRASFAGVWLKRESAFPHGGFVAAANHHTWWDGFVPYLLHHERRDRRRFAVMMNDDQLRRFPYFRFGGAFSVDAASARAARASVAYAGTLARDGCVWIFPDGELRPPSAPLAFTSGFVHAARSAAVPVVPVAMRFVFLDRQRPEIFVAAGTPLDPRERQAVVRTQAAVSSLLAEIDSALCRSGREEFELKLRGRAGVDDRVALARR